MDYTQLNASQITGLVARGEASALEVLEAFIQRIETVNPRLNAVVVKRYEQAREEARAIDRRWRQGGELGPLAGVPVTVKECLALQGTPTTFGLAWRKSILEQQDDPYVALLRQAGAIIVGKTNVAQLLMFYESDNPVYGRCNHPLDANRTPGGSSGGEAAIIAAGGSPLGLGTDIGGSTRVPAAFCGISSLKPTMGRTPDPGRWSVPFGQRAVLSQVGVLGRDAASVALGLKVINPGRAAFTWSPGVEAPAELGEPMGVEISGLRIGVYERDGFFEPSPAIRRAVREASARLEQAGAQVVEWSPPDVSQAMRIYISLILADGGEIMRRNLRNGPAVPQSSFMLFAAGRSRVTLSLLRSLFTLFGQRRVGEMLGAFGNTRTSHYFRLVEAQLDYQKRFAQAMDAAPGGALDALICPAFSLPALTHGASRDLMSAGSYAMLFNLLGYPAGVSPVTMVQPGEESDRPRSREMLENLARKVETGSAGLPVGVQVVARPWREDVVLALMGLIEEKGD